MFCHYTRQARDLSKTLEYKTSGMRVNQSKEQERDDPSQEIMEFTEV